MQSYAECMNLLQRSSSELPSLHVLENEALISLSADEELVELLVSLADIQFAFRDLDCSWLLEEIQE